MLRKRETESNVADDEIGLIRHLLGCPAAWRE